MTQAAARGALRHPAQCPPSGHQSQPWAATTFGHTAAERVSTPTRYKGHAGRANGQASRSQQGARLLPGQSAGNRLGLSLPAVVTIWVDPYDQLRELLEPTPDPEPAGLHGLSERNGSAEVRHGPARTSCQPGWACLILPLQSVRVSVNVALVAL